MNEMIRDIFRGKIIRSLIILLIYTVILIHLTQYIIINTDMMQRFLSAPKSLIVIGVITTIASVLLNAPLDIVCARVYGFKLEMKAAVFFTFITSAINLILPFQSGSAIKAIYYKRAMGLAYSKFLSIMSGTIIMQLLIIFATSVLSLLLMMHKWNKGMKYVLPVSLVVLIGMFVIFLILHMQDKILDLLPFKTYTRPIVAGFFELFNDKKAMALCFLIYMTNTILGGIRCAIIFICLGTSTEFVNGMLYYGMYCASSIISILPGNIGISEILVGGMNMILGADFDVGVIVVFANRVYYYIVTFVGAMIAAIPAWDMFKRKIEYN